MSFVAPPTLTPPPPERPELPDGVEPTPLEPAWTPMGVLYTFGLGLAGTLIGLLLVVTVAAAFGADADDLPPGVNLLLTVVQDAAFVGAALFIASTVARPAPWQFGLRGIRAGPFVGWILVAYLAFGVFAFLYGALVEVTEDADQLDTIGADDGLLGLLAAAFLVTVIAPIAEEFFFRGYVFGALRRWRGAWVGAAITGAIFGAIHLGSTPDARAIPVLAFLGFVLCALYIMTRSLYPSIVMHAINNCIAFAALRDGWTWEVAVLLAGSLGCIGLFALVVRRFGGPAPALLALK